MGRGRQVQGTSWPQRQTLRALARTQVKHGGPVLARQVALGDGGIDAKLETLVGRGLAAEVAGEMVTTRRLGGGASSYRRRRFQVTDQGWRLLEATQGEPAPG